MESGRDLSLFSGQFTPALGGLRTDRTIKGHPTEISLDLKDLCGYINYVKGSCPRLA
jgi:hypothetical protein